MVDGFFILDLDWYYSSLALTIVHIDDSDVMIWHARLGHIGQERMTILVSEGLLGSLAKVSFPVCEPCLIGKASRKPFGKATRATHPLELVHSDIHAPMNVRACHDASYFLTLIDDYLCFSYVYLIAYRYEALDCFKCFVMKVENQKEKKLKLSELIEVTNIYLSN